MESVVLGTPEGIDARLGWDPAMSEHDRKRVLARQIIGARLGIDPDTVRIEREAPTVFGHHTRLIASVADRVLPIAVHTASFRAGTVVAVADMGMPLGIDLRDPFPDAASKAAIRAHSHVWEGSSERELLNHWTRVQAVLAADGRGMRVRPESVRLDVGGHTGWIADRPLHYTVLDVSAGAFVITIAYAPAPEPAPSGRAR